MMKKYVNTIKEHPLSILCLVISAIFISYPFHLDPGLKIVTRTEMVLHAIAIFCGYFAVVLLPYETYRLYKKSIDDHCFSLPATLALLFYACIGFVLGLGMIPEDSLKRHLPLSEETFLLLKDFYLALNIFALVLVFVAFAVAIYYFYQMSDLTGSEYAKKALIGIVLSILLLIASGFVYGILLVISFFTALGLILYCFVMMLFIFHVALVLYPVTLMLLKK